MTSFKKINTQIRKYIYSDQDGFFVSLKNEMEDEQLFNDIKNMITANNVNELNYNGSTLLHELFTPSIISQRIIKLAKMLIKEKGANINISHLNSPPLRWFLFNLNHPDTVIDFELFEMLSNNNIDWNMIKDGIKYIFSFNIIDSFKWLYSMYMKGCPLEIFKQNLLTSSYNKFLEYKSEQESNEPVYTKSTKSVSSELVFNDLIRAKLNKNQKYKRNLLNNINNIPKIISGKKDKLKETKEKKEKKEFELKGLELELKELEKSIFVLEKDIINNEKELLDSKNELEEIENTTFESLKEKITNELINGLTVSDLIELISKKTSQ